MIFVLFFIGFCVKLPSFPFHTWLPDAHVEAPTPISMILAGILLKIGGYGLIRLAWPLAPLGAYAYAWPVAVLGVFSILYGALVAMAQTDFKKLVAYSSVSHMGYVTLGMAVMNLAGDPRYYAYGVNGAMFMMIAHGITSAGMFFLVGVIYDRAHTRDLNKLGGLYNVMPAYGAVSFLIFFGSMGLPGLCGFIAEVFVVLSAFNYNWVAGRPRRGGGDPDGGLHPLDAPARLPRAERTVQGPARPERPRVDHLDPAGPPDRRAGRLPAVAAPELDEPVGRSDGPIGRDRHLPAGRRRASPTGQAPDRTPTTCRPGAEVASSPGTIDTDRFVRCGLSFAPSRIGWRAQAVLAGMSG